MKRYYGETNTNFFTNEQRSDILDSWESCEMSVTRNKWV